MFRVANQDFFKHWTPEMAYVLGFFAADGTMIVNNRGAHFIEFHITDRHLLFQIRALIGSNHKIAKRTEDNLKHKAGYRLQIGSKEIFNDLRTLGFTPRKSKRMKLPNIPTIVFGDFVRGYFDGDGCVYFKKHIVKGRKNPRWVFSTRFTAGSRDFLDLLHRVLLTRGIKRGFIVRKSNNSGFDLVFSHHDSLALFHLMYDTVPDSGPYLFRKYNLFRKAVRTLYGKEMRL
ncbi:MAG: LAGLIDADG family homing endonuclease [bacterium]|nr:LAGLIDADG family homing endonuclease [bacterium]